VVSEEFNGDVFMATSKERRMLGYITHDHYANRILILSKVRLIYSHVRKWGTESVR